MGLLRRETAADAFFREQLDVSVEFLGEVAVAKAAKEAPKQPVPAAAQHAGHALAPFSARKRATIPVACSHWFTLQVNLLKLAAAVIPTLFFSQSQRRIDPRRTQRGNERREKRRPAQHQHGAPITSGSCGRIR
jgi:hypothetical protein